MTIELNEAETAILAANIEMLKLSLNLIDLEYLMEVHKQFTARASLRQSAFILIPNYSHEHTELEQQQGAAMENLIRLILSLKRCDELKEKLKQSQDTRKQMESIFAI